MSIALLDVELLQFKCYVTSSIEVKMAHFAIYGLTLTHPLRIILVSSTMVQCTGTNNIGRD